MELYFHSPCLPLWHVLEQLCLHLFFFFFLKKVPSYVQCKQAYVMISCLLTDEPPRIVTTNLSVNKSLELITGHNMTVFCKSEGMPFPATFWFKVGYYWIKYPVCEEHNHSASIASAHWHNVCVTPLIASADFEATFLKSSYPANKN